MQKGKIVVLSVTACLILFPITFYRSMPLMTEALGIDLVWIGILIALNLQTSFLTPPFGFSLFYLKGVAPPEVKTSELYRGIIPFVSIQILLLVLVIIFPELVSFLPQLLEK